MRSVRLINEDELAPDDRRKTAELLAAEWGEAWIPDAYAGPYAPEFRAIARDDDLRVIGQVSAFAIPTSPPRNVYGIGDLVVDADSRGSGAATEICASAVAECVRRGAETILVDTLAARSIFLRLGFEPVEAFRFFYVDGDACVRREHWMVSEREPAGQPVELLRHADF